jgi:hypothetical protein
MAAAVKLPAAVAIVFILWGVVRDRPSLRARTAAVARGGLAALGTIAAATAASGLSWGWLGALGVPGTVAPRLAVVNDLAWGFDHYLGLSFMTALHIWRDLGMLLALALVAHLLLRTPRARWIPALGAALIVVAVLGPTFYPWYLTWGLMLVAATAADRWERAIIWASVVPAFAVAPGGEGWLDLLSKIARTWVARSVVGAVVAVAALTAYRPGWITSFFRADGRHAGDHDALGDGAAPHFEPAALSPTSNGATGDGRRALAAPPTTDGPSRRDESEEVVS